MEHILCLTQMIIAQLVELGRDDAKRTEYAYMVCSMLLHISFVIW